MLYIWPQMSIVFAGYDESSLCLTITIKWKLTSCVVVDSSWMQFLDLPESKFAVLCLLFKIGNSM